MNTRNTMTSSFHSKILIPSRPEGLQLYFEETPTQVFSCEICETFNLTYFEDHVQTTVSDVLTAKIKFYSNLLPLALPNSCKIHTVHASKMINKRDTKYLSVFSPNVGKYGPEITPYLDTFHAVTLILGSL